MKNYGLPILCLLVLSSFGSARVAFAQDKSPGDKPIVGLIPKALKPVKLDGKLDEWDPAFVTPLHVGNPDFADRGAHVLYMWDDESIYIGLRCLDQKPAHAAEAKVGNGDALGFYLDTRRGTQFGGPEYRPGTLHMYWTPFTGSAIKPQLRVRDIPAFKNVKLEGAAVAAELTPWGYTAEFKLPWANFPNFAIESGEVIGLECELCSGSGEARLDRTFAFSSPAVVDSPAALSRLQLVDKLDPEALKPLGRALMPFALTKATNYDWLYNTVCISPTIEKAVAKLEGKIVDERGEVKKAANGVRRLAVPNSDFNIWRQRWELHDVAPGVYTLELAALDKDGKVLVSRKEKFVHGDVALAKSTDDTPPKKEEPPKKEAPPKEKEKEKEKEKAKEKEKEPEKAKEKAKEKEPEKAKEKEKEKSKTPDSDDPPPAKKSEKPKPKEGKSPPEKESDLPPKDEPKGAA